MIRIGVLDRDSSSSCRAFVTKTLDEHPTVASVLADDQVDRLIVVKPNWVQESHEYNCDCWEPVITDPRLLLSILECLADRIIGRATICVCDAPHTYADFSAILCRGDFGEKFAVLQQDNPHIRFELLDLRREFWMRKEGVVVERLQNKDDPRGYVKANLAGDSLFYGHPGEGRYYGADYDSTVVNRHHHGEKQEYLLAGTPVACDLFINVPKMKTHKKTGITCCLKNLVGINGDKNWLPHHTEGSPLSGGDEFPDSSLRNRVEGRAKRIGQTIALRIPFVGTWLYRKMRNAGKQVLGDSESVIRNGNWAGNDTCWRMALDLNRALLYINEDGTWRNPPSTKPYLAIVDGIVGGQGNGPLCPDPVMSNVLVSGTNPAEVDAVVARLMGFDPHTIPLIANAFQSHRWPIATRPIDEVKVLDDRLGRELALPEIVGVVDGGFAPHFGWATLRPGSPGVNA